MGKSELLDKIHQHIDQADNRLRKMVYAMMEAYGETDSDEFELSPLQKAELDKRKSRHVQEEGKAYGWKEVKEQARKQTIG